MNDRMQAALPVVAGLLTLLLAGWLYWPGSAGPPLLDDHPSVLVIGDLKANPALIWDYVFGDRSGPSGRPVSMASFVLEKLFLDGDLATSKQVNIVLHLVNGGLVIWLFWLLFRHIAVPGYRWLAVVLGAAWILSPLYVSTVLYMVQRMAMLSATFMLFACVFYVWWRQKLAAGRFSILLFALLLVSMLLAFFSKENAVVVVPVLLLAEALWFQFGGVGGRNIPWLRNFTLGSISLGLAAALLILTVGYEGLAAGFERRDFTLEERLLTQARAVWDYVGQLYLPDVFRMGLYHDDTVVSRGLTDPPSTLYAVLAWLAVLVLSLALLRWRQGRYLVLGPAWFLVAHSVESTVLPLELYFEHRNYFPGIGLFLLVGTLFALLVKQWPQVRSPLLVYLAGYALWLATLTGSQAQIWSSHPLLILNHLNAHPHSFRANADMAVQMATLGEYAAARRYSAAAYALSKGERSGDHAIRDLALACIANQAVEPEQIDRLGVDNPERPFGSVDTLHTLVLMLQDDACPGFDRTAFANRMAAIFLAKGSPATASANIYLGLALLENTLQRWANAAAYIDLFLELAPASTQGLLMKLHFASALGKVEDVDAVRARLLEMQAAGQLTVGEQQTLSLYLEN